MEGKVNPQLWLSYKCNDPKSIAVRESLEKLCAENSIDLVYDKNGTGDGDSLLRFADDLSASRFVVLLVNDEYFCSSWTLYEFIKISELIENKQRMLVLLPMSKAILKPIKIIDYRRNWGSDAALRFGLLELLRCEESDIWPRIQKAWGNVVVFKKSKLLSVVEEDTTVQEEEKLSKFFFMLNEYYNKALSDSKTKFHGLLVHRISTIFKQWPSATWKLSEELRSSGSENPSMLATNLLGLETIQEAILLIAELLENDILDRISEEERKPFIHDMKSVCGWLLLNSINPAWWFNTELRYKRGSSEGVSHVFSGVDTSYIEVIISRATEKSAQFQIQKGVGGSAVPGTHLSPLLYLEVTAEEAVGQVFLRKIYEDLLRSNEYTIPKEIDKLVANMLRMAKNQSKRGKQLYYLIPYDVLESWETQNWFMGAKEKLGRYILFVGFGEKAKPYNVAASKEDQEMLIEGISHFLRIADSKKVDRDYS